MAERASPSAGRITPRRERFAQLVAEGNSYVDAARKAFNCSNMQPQSIYPWASRLAANSTIRARIAILKNQALKAAGLTNGYVVSRLMTTAEAAQADGAYAAAIQGYTKLGEIADTPGLRKLGAQTNVQVNVVNAAVDQLSRELSIEELRALRETIRSTNSAMLPPSSTTQSADTRRDTATGDDDAT